MSKQDKVDLTIVGCIVTIVILCCTICIYNYPVWVTKSIVERAASQCKRNDTAAGRLNEVDKWDMPLVLTRDDQSTYIAYLVTSSGRDKEMGTEDDIYFGVIDINKSRIVGDWVARKSKEAFIGFSDGWKKESKFKLTNPE